LGRRAVKKAYGSLSFEAELPCDECARPHRPADRRSLDVLFLEEGYEVVNRRSVVALAGLGAPLLVTLAVLPFRASVANTNAALLLVVVIVAVAAQGYRLAGGVAAFSSGVCFDFFLTQPYQRFSIRDRADIETTLLLLVVGVAVTELAVWGHAQQAEASRVAGYTAGIQDALAAVGDGASATAMIDQVCRQLTLVLALKACRFDYGTGVVGGNHPRLRPDGQVEVDGAVCDVEHLGLPVAHDIEIPLMNAGRYLGRFVLTASSAARPSLAQRLVAVTLAERAAGLLAVGRTTAD
jgi:Domain of unknown function (DUF4118)